MPNKIILKKSSVAARVPIPDDLDYGELALNYTDGALYYKNSSNSISTIGGSSVDLTQPGPIGDSVPSTGTFTTLNALSAANLSPDTMGVNISNGRTVTAITRLATGSGYTSVPTITISAPTLAGGTQATATPAMEPGTITVVSGGTGYAVNDVLTFVGGTVASQSAQVTVSAVSGGVITAVTQTRFGRYTGLPANPISVTGGSGTGATFSVASYIVSPEIVITNAGSGYVQQPTITFSGGGGSGANAYVLVGGTAIIRSLGAVGVASMDFRTPASATNNVPVLRLRDISATSGNVGFVMLQNNNGYCQVVAQGPATSNLNLAANGSGRINFNTQSTNEVTQFRVENTTSAVNFLQVTGSATGNQPQLTAQGSDTNITMSIASKGSGAIIFNSAGAEQFRSGTTASTANSLIISGATTSNFPLITTRGTDTNVGLELRLKGTPAGPGFRVSNNNGSNVCFAVTTSGTNVVNYIRADPSAAGLASGISAQGSDSNIDLELTPKGTGVVTVKGNHGLDSQIFTTSSTSSQVIASWPAAKYRAIKLVVSATDITAGKYHASEILLVNSGTATEFTEYAVVNLGGVCGTYATDVSGGNIRLLVTPATTNATLFEVAATLINV